jgi:ribosomal protein L32
MAGKLCRPCGRQTFFESLTGRTCTQCNFKVVVPKDIRTEAGYIKCPSCKKFKLPHGDCKNCGALSYVTKPEKKRSK